MDDFFFVCDISSFLIRIFSDFNLNNYCQEVRVGLEFWYSNFEGLEVIFVEFGVGGFQQFVVEMSFFFFLFSSQKDYLNSKFFKSYKSCFLSYKLFNIVVFQKMKSNIFDFGIKVLEEIKVLVLDFCVQNELGRILDGIEELFEYCFEREVVGVFFKVIFSKCDGICDFFEFFRDFFIGIL